MPSVLDVAAHLQAIRRSLTTMQLQKLVYYAQAWSLVWDGAPLFAEPIEAWQNGPIVDALYQQHRGQRVLRHTLPGDPARLSAAQQATIDAVLAFYGNRTGEWLSELTHRERPWQTARGRTPPTARSRTVIDHDTIADYYRQLPHGPGKQLPGELAEALEFMLTFEPEDWEAMQLESKVSVRDEVAFLNGQGPDPWQ